MLHIARHHQHLCIAGKILDNKLHQHHAMQLVWSSSKATIQSPRHPDLSATLILIDGNIPHQLSMADGVIVLMDMHSAQAAHLRHHWLSEHHIRAISPPSQKAALEHVHELLSTLTPTNAKTHTIDHRISKTLGWLDMMESQQRWHEVSLKTALEQIKLSESRFLHLFTEHVGSPWRNYLIWRRAIIAAQFVAQGDTFTQAAHRAGYSDAAHLSRQFKNLFGYVPSKVL